MPEAALNSPSQETFEHDSIEDTNMGHEHVEDHLPEDHDMTEDSIPQDVLEKEVNQEQESEPETELKEVPSKTTKTHASSREIPPGKSALPFSRVQKILKADRVRVLVMMDSSHSENIATA